MRIGIYLDQWRDGGVPVFIERLEQQFTSMGHEVLLFLANPYPKREQMPKELYRTIKSKLGERCVSLNLNSFPKRWRAIHFKNVLLSFKVDCLLINQFNSEIPLLRTIAREVPLISIGHTDSDYYYREFLETLQDRAGHIAVSRRIYEKSLSYVSPDEANKIHYIPYGLEDQTAFQPAPQGPLHVIYCARLDPLQKRCQDLVPLWQEYRRRGGSGRMTILGSGKGEQYLRKTFQAEIAAGRIIMRGHLSSPEALREISQSDVILNISNFEGLPQVVLEGASLGLYPILSDIESGHREIVETLGFGTLCHVGDHSAYAQKLIELEKHLDELRSKRASRREKTWLHYALRDCCAKYLSVLSGVQRGAVPDYTPEIYNPTLQECFQRAIMLLKYRRHYSIID
jgi:glycosyltransferase involved in cell wall biosynthesis